MPEHVEIVKICDACNKRQSELAANWPMESSGHSGWFKVEAIGALIPGVTKNPQSKFYAACSTECLMDLADKLYQESKTPPESKA